MNRWLPQSREVVWGTVVYDDNTICKKTHLKFIDQESLLKWWTELESKKSYKADLEDLKITHREWVPLDDYLKTRGEET